MRLAEQPSWPFEYFTSGVVEVKVGRELAEEVVVRLTKVGVRHQA